MKVFYGYGLLAMRPISNVFFILLLLASQVRPEKEQGAAAAENSPADSGQGAFKISGVEFDIRETQGQGSFFEELAGNAAGIRVGDLVNEKTLGRSLESLKNCGRFQEADMETTASPDGWRVKFRLKPHFFVKDLLLKGAWPLFEKEVRNAMTLYVGAPYTQSLMEEQEDLIRELYRQEGISIDTISASAERDAKDGNYIVSIRISPGRWFRISEVNIRGCRGFRRLSSRYQLGGPRELLPLMGRRFVRKNYDDVIKKILNKYRKKGFYDAVIRDTVIKDSSSYRVRLEIDVEEGFHNRVVFLGNAHTDRGELMKQCRFGLGNRNNMGVKKSREALEEYYRSLGFENVQVDIDMKPGPEEKTVIFNIREGLFSRVGDLTIRGNNVLSKKEILEQVLLSTGKLKQALLWTGRPFSSRVLAGDVDGIIALYQQKGFSGTSVDTILKRTGDKDGEVRVSIEFQISEGRRRLAGDVRLEMPEMLRKLGMKEQLLLKSGGPFVKSLVQRDRETLSALAAEEGYPYCKVRSVEKFNADSSVVSVAYIVEPGDRAYMGRVYITGNFKTNPSVIDREIQMKTGDPFSLRRILESQRNVQDLPLFGSVQMKPAGLAEERDTVHIFLGLEEERPLYLKVRGGYESDIGVFGESRLGDKNLFGLNKHGWVAGRLHHTTGRLWEYGDAGWRAESGLLEPRLWGSRISASTVLSQERVNEAGQDFFVDRTTASVGLMRRFWRVISLGTAFEYELRKATGVRTDSSLTVGDQQDLAKYRNNLIIRPTLSYDGRNSFIRPSRGFFSSYAIEISTGMDNNIDDFIRYDWAIKGFTSPVPMLVLGAVGRWQRINGATLAEDQLLFLGGTQDVRGYPKNRLAPGGGNLAVSGSLEARVEMFWGFELALFSDAGKVSTTADPFAADVYSPGKFKYTAGTGLRYITPIGPVGLLYGHQLNPVGYGAWHFSLGYTF